MSLTFHFSLTATVTGLTLTVVCFVRALLGFFDRYWLYFPVGGVTDYDRAAATPLIILMCLYLALGLYFFYLSLPLYYRTTKARVTQFSISIAVLVLLTIVTEVAIPWYFISYLGLNSGQGG